MDTFKTLEKELPGYINQIKNSNSEAKIIHEFTSFIQKVFDISAKEIDFEVSVKSNKRQLKGRIDAVFGNIILEFKKSLKTNLNTAEEELEKYFQSLFEKTPKEKHIGIATDGLLFKVYQPIIENNIVSRLEQINEINLEISDTTTILNWFDSYFFSSTKIIPTSEHLKQTFGINSPTYAIVRQELFELFDKVKYSRRIKLKFENWSRYLEIVYGDKPNEINLFIAHTYLSTFVKLLVYLKLTSKNQFKNYDILPILYGNVFSKIGIHNFVEDDFFTWVMYVTIRKRASLIFEKILRDLEIYDLDKINEDVLKELYQDMVHPAVRKQLGEFYTPDWLAEKIVVETLGEKPEQSVLDPSCGSGTFLFKTILYKIKKFKEIDEDNSKILSHILENVIGFDIHPLAALIAKTNYLLGLRELIHSRIGPISIPVYLSDSIKVPDKKMKITNEMPTFEFSTHVLEKKFSFPESIIDDNVKMDEIIEKMKEHGHELEDKIGTIRDESYNIDVGGVSKNLKESFKRSLFNIVDENVKKVLLENISTLFELIEHNSDSIWPYILRNMYRPIATSHKKVDVVLGNPPWIAFQAMHDEKYQLYLKEKSIHYGLVDKKKVHNIPNMELASLFFCHCVNQYLKDDGTIAFVMPRSVLDASQHVNFRLFEKPRVKLKLVYDLKDVKPLFRIPSCVLIAKNNLKTEYPVKSQIYSGKLKSTNAQLKEAESSLKVSNSTFTPVIRIQKPSLYHKLFAKGADLIPRNFWFVEIKTDSFLGFNPECPHIISAENKNAHPPWKDVKLDGNVSKEFLFNTVVATDLIPFGILQRRLVFLPIIVNGGKIETIRSSEQYEAIQPETSKYLKTVEDAWKKNSTGTASKMTPYEWINYQNKLSRQNPNAKFRVLYVGSATYMTSCVIEPTSEYSFSIDGTKFITNQFFADVATYYFDTDSKDEAYYLAAIFNSKILDDLIKPEQSKGDFGPRNIHKLPLTFNIPKYDLSNPNHRKLAEIGLDCAKKIEIILPTIKTKSVGNIRGKIRDLLQTEFDKINKITELLLNDKIE